MRWSVFVLAILTSCSPLLRELTVEQVQMEAQSVVFTLVNDSEEGVEVLSAEIVANINGEPLLTATLNEGFEIGAKSREVVRSEWSVTKHDPATLYALRRRALSSYIERITFDYSVDIEGQRPVSRRGVKGKRLLRRVENFEKLLQQ